MEKKFDYDAAVAELEAIAAKEDKAVGRAGRSLPRISARGEGEGR